MNGEPALLALDLGTTHSKAALYGLDGTPLALASVDSSARRAPGGYIYYDPDELWQSAAGALQAVMSSPAAARVRLAGLGLTSMAETAVLLDRSTGRPRSPFLAWYDRSSTPQAQLLAALPEAPDLFLSRGIYPNFKCGVAKLLWLKEQGTDLSGAVWLSCADYICCRLTGALVTDYSLAVRTFALDLDQKTWDAPWLEAAGLPADLFPTLLPSGAPAGAATGEAARQAGLPDGLPVAVSGHDHVCGAAAVSALEVGRVFNSAGTAESLLGALPDRPLNEADRASGLVFGLHVVPGRRYWMGGISASGGSVEWLRGVLADPPLDYAGLEQLFSQAPSAPTGILYFPYLAGSGSPHTDLLVRGAFIGLDSTHSRAHLARAVLEGTAFELECIRLASAQVTGAAAATLLSAGGGTRSPVWMQIKADVTGCRMEAQSNPETTLLGAALLAGVGAGVYDDLPAALQGLAVSPPVVYQPDPDRHQVYQRLFRDGYLGLQAALRDWGRRAAVSS